MERAGLVWAYLGPRETPPPLPDLEPAMLPDSSVQVYQRECNWVQALEGDIDTCHTVFLHLGSVRADEVVPGTWAHYALGDRAPRYQVADMDFGVMYGAYRPAEADTEYWRIANFLFPFYAMVPTGVLGLEVRVRAWVPMDDEHTLAISIARSPQGTRTAGRQVVRPPETLPNTTDWYGRFRCVADQRNDYLIDRAAQRTTSYTGIDSIFLQDQAVTESMGPIYDRTNEHLGTSDQMIIRTRKRLIDAARALRDTGKVPPGVDDPGVYAVRSGGVLLPRGADWIEGTRELRKAGVEHPKLTRAVLGGLPAV
jgi:phenylpropionate dioxygenase-like ring-hydroxylating dioxygenase large terminal subunit